MNSTVEKKSLETLKAELDQANKILQKAVRKAVRYGVGPDAFKDEKANAMKAYRAYWDAEREESSL